MEARKDKKASTLILQVVDNVRDMPIERHPWPPFLPDDAKVLIMGTFPPAASRWSMDFYYPNRINDFWRVMGLIFHKNPEAFYNPTTRQFRLDDIKAMLNERGIALNDTGRAVRRTRGNASDKYLEIVEPVPLDELLAQMPNCHAVATTGEKAASVIAELTDTAIPKMGECVAGPQGLDIWRMPSTSRAYPLPLVKKAEYYATMFRHLDILD